MYTTLLAGNAVYALRCEDIESFCVLPKVEYMPGAPRELRGNVPYRSSYVPVVGLRELFNQTSLLVERKELADSLVQREKDHIDWVEDLKKSVVDGTEFRKTTDPTKCAFGQWYYNFRTFDVQLSRELRSFEEPHADIHKLGITVLDLVRLGKKEEALAVIQQAQGTTLAGLLVQFGRVRSMLVNEIKEVFVVVRCDNKRLGIVVDSIIDIVKDSDISALETQIDLPSDFFHSSFQINKNTQKDDTSRVAHLLNVAPMVKFLNLQNFNSVNEVSTNV